MATKIKSEEGTWQTIASRWNSGDVSSIADDFTAALLSAEEVMRATDTISMPISINITQGEIDELRRRQQIMVETTPDIHGEVDELIDNPFVRELSGLLENVYSLNPTETLNSYIPSSASTIFFTNLVLSTYTVSRISKHSKNLSFARSSSELKYLSNSSV